MEANENIKKAVNIIIRAKVPRNVRESISGFNVIVDKIANTISALSLSKATTLKNKVELEVVLSDIQIPGFIADRFTDFYKSMSEAIFPILVSFGYIKIDSGGSSGDTSGDTSGDDIEEKPWWKKDYSNGDAKKWNRKFPNFKDLVKDPQKFMEEVMDFFIQKPDEITELVDTLNIFGFNVFTAEIGIPFPFSVPFYIWNKMKKIVESGTDPAKWIIGFLIGLFIFVATIISVVLAIWKFGLIQKMLELV